MLYWLLQTMGVFAQDVGAAALVRGFCALATAFVVVLGMGNRTIDHLRTLKYGQAVRDDGPKSHLIKNGTPTMGGVLILGSILISVLLWADLSNPYVWILLVVMGLFGAVGFADDWLKIRHKNPQGLIARKKYFWLSVGALFVGLALYVIARGQDAVAYHAMQDLFIPLFKSHVIALSLFPFGLGFVVFTYFVINGTSNAVNLTDGLDGLVALPLVLCALGLGAFAYLSGDPYLAGHLHLPHIIYNLELAIVAGAISGGCLGFLWFNAHPAQVFMGDVGALPLGGMLGTMAVMTRQELVFVVMGGIFVAEALSVMAQVASYKLYKKRVLLMAPLHHHFEEKGLPETKVVVRFWIVAWVLLGVSLLTLIIR